MTLLIKKPTGAKLVFAKDFKLDIDAQTYITAVETADGQALETATRYAINNFVIGCKSDGIWNAIKASCILAGARTLNGALVPLVGAAPTNFNFVSGDYNRKTGLLGNGTTTYLNSNRNNNADPQNSKHVAVFPTLLPGSRAIISTTGEPTNSTYYATNQGGIAQVNCGQVKPVGTMGQNKLTGLSRASESGFGIRTAGTSVNVSASSGTPGSGDISIYGGGSANCRLAFYSIGESLDLALLDARVTTLINAFGAAIP